MMFLVRTLTAFALFLGTAACQPSDVKVKTAKDRLAAGEVVEFTEPGYRRPSCSSRAPDWADLTITDTSERERVILGTQSAVLHPGRHSCYRVGSVVSIKSGNVATGLGQVRIRKLALVYLDKLDSRALKGRYFGKADDFNRYKETFARVRMRENHENVVTIVEFEYVDGSAADQKLIRERELLLNAGDGYQESTADGEKVGECRNNNVWKELVVPAEFHAAVLDGRIKSWYRLGNFNCLPHGQIADVKTAPSADAASAGQVKIKRAKIFKADALLPKRFDLPGYPFADLKARIENENRERRQEWIVVYDFDSLSAPAADCRPQSLNAMAGADPSATRFETLAPAGHCLKVGDLVILNILGNDGAAVEIAAKVVEVNERNGAALVTVESLSKGVSP